MKRFSLLPLILLSFLFLLPHRSPVSAQVPVTRTLDVVAAVAPTPPDYQLGLSSNSTGPVSQDTGVTYTLTYGSRLLYAAGPVILQVDWTNGTVAGDQIPTVEVVNYVFGSSVASVGSLSPVVDPVLRRISWVIPSLPGDTLDQTIRFELRTNSTYTGSSLVTWQVRARLIAPALTLPDEVVFGSFYFDSLKFRNVGVSSPQPAAPAPSVFPSVPVSAPSASPSAPGAAISHIGISGISADSISYSVWTASPASLSVLWGQSPRSLTNVMEVSDLSSYHLVSISGLSPGTRYYFQIMAAAQAGQKSVSDIFTYTTAATSPPLDISDASIVLSWGQDIISSQTIREAQSGAGSVILPSASPFRLTLTLPRGHSFTSLSMIIRDRLTLGANSISSFGEWVVPLQLRQAGMYLANLTTPPRVGEYEIVARFSDTRGNIIEQPVSRLKVSPRLTVYDESTQKALADARVFFERADPLTGKYERLSYIFSHVPNPQYTDSLGQLDIVLPQGDYRISVGNLGYAESFVTFSLSSDTDDSYPKVYLRKDAGNPRVYIQFLQNSTYDLFSHTLLNVQSLSFSGRFFSLISVLIVLTSVVICFILFYLRTHLHLTHTHTYLWQQLHRLNTRNRSLYISGTLVDIHNQPISGGRIEIIDAFTGDNLGHAHTHRLGRFYIRNHFSDTSIKIIFSRESYLKYELISNPDTDKLDNLRIILLSDTDPLPSARVPVSEFMVKVYGLLFEFFLFTSLVLETIFLFVFGLWPTLPFLVLSFINILLWVLFLIESRASAGESLSRDHL